jgi:hypothetical protein
MLESYLGPHSCHHDSKISTPKGFHARYQLDKVIEKSEAMIGLQAIEGTSVAQVITTVIETKFEMKNFNNNTRISPRADP